MLMRASDFFNEGEKILLRRSIELAERETSGELRVHVEISFHGEVLDRAATVFARLGMQNTRLRNGVLFYFSILNRKFAILGDAGINKVVPADFWEQIRMLMSGYFSKGEFAQGLCKGIEMAGQQLKAYFPHEGTDRNELSDDISFES